MMVESTQYIARLEELARKHPTAPVVDRDGNRLAVTPAQCVAMGRRAPAGPVEGMPRMRPATRLERRRGVTGKVLVT